MKKIIEKESDLQVSKYGFHEMKVGDKKEIVCRRGQKLAVRSGAYNFAYLNKPFRFVVRFKGSKVTVWRIT